MVISSLKEISPAKGMAFIKSYCIKYGSHQIWLTFIKKMGRYLGGFFKTMFNRLVVFDLTEEFMLVDVPAIKRIPIDRDFTFYQKERETTKSPFFLKKIW